MSIAGKNFYVKDKVVIVTGASSGIGEATARLFSKRGAKVALVSRSKEKLEKLSEKLSNSSVFVCDMTDPKQVKAMVRNIFEHYGRIDILINNAGQGYDASIEKINLDTFHKVFDLDVVGPLVAMQEVIPIMRKQGGGFIVNISSGTALMALPNMAAYSSLKRALVGISLTAHEELKSDNIFVSVVYPFITDTNFEKNTIRGGKPDLENDEWDRKLPPADSADYIAGKILDSLKTHDKEIFAHDWMKPSR